MKRQLNEFKNIINNLEKENFNLKRIIHHLESGSKSNIEPTSENSNSSITKEIEKAECPQINQEMNYLSGISNNGENNYPKLSYSTNKLNWNLLIKKANTEIENQSQSLSKCELNSYCVNCPSDNSIKTIQSENEDKNLSTEKDKLIDSFPKSGEQLYCNNSIIFSKENPYQNKSNYEGECIDISDEKENNVLVNKNQKNLKIIRSKSPIINTLPNNNIFSEKIKQKSKIEKESNCSKISKKKLQLEMKEIREDLASLENVAKAILFQ